MIKLHALASVLIAGSLVGCYGYAPADLGDLSPGETVRAQLTPEARERFSEEFIDSERFLEGEFLAGGDAEFHLGLPKSVRQEGFFFETLRERVRLRTSQVIELERRELDRFRTYLALGVGAAALTGIIWKAFSRETGGNTIEGPDPGTAQSGIPLFIMRLR